MKTKRAVLYSIISGLLLALTWNSIFPSLGLFISFIPILLLIRNKLWHYSKIFNFTFLSFFIFHLGTVWWLTISSFWGGLTIMTLNSMVMSITIVVIYRVRQILGFTIGIILFIPGWLSFEYLHYHWELSWPFMNLGNWLGQQVKWIQWYEYTGVLGGTLWILLVNTLLYLTFVNFNKKSKQKAVISLISSFTIVVLPITISNNIYNNQVINGPEKNVTIIQPNINPYTEKYNSKLYREQINRQIKLAIDSSSRKTDCFLFPESSFPIYLNEDEITSENFPLPTDSLLSNIKTPCILGGLYSYKLNRHKDSLFYNTAFMYDSNKKLQLYHKSKLVVGVEKMPYHEYFSFLNNLSVDFGGYNSSLTEDKHRIIFASSNNLNIAPVICFESVYGEFVTGFIKKGATSIAVITNDGWWGDSPGYKQHLLSSKLRAIETRRDIARAANTGTSCIINKKGEITSQLPAWEEGVLNGGIKESIKTTFYVKHGDYIGKFSLFCTIIILITSLIKRIKTKLNQKNEINL